MRSINLHKDTFLVIFLVLLLSFSAFRPAEAATMSDYCVSPPFVTQAVPPLVLLTMGRDHKFWYTAYNDAYDLDGDGLIDVGYKHSIDYYGYFDSNRCYTYQSAGSPKGFIPVTASVATNKFCAAGQWSGNILNYLTMSKMDAVRKIFYGGNRVSASSTVLERAYIPQDAHSWGKEFTGRLCMGTGLSCINGSGVATNSGCSADSDCPTGSTCGSTTLYTNQCESDINCDTANGFSCVDQSINLIGIAAATPGSDCFPNAVSKVCSVAGTACTGDTDCPGEQCVYTRTGQILLLTYPHASSKTSAANANNHANLVASYEPNLMVASPQYVSTMSVTTAALDPRVDHGADYNYYLITQFEVTPGNAGTWTFGLDANEAAEVEIDGTVVVTRFGANVSCAAACTPPPATGTIVLTPGWHTFIVRHFEQNNSGSAAARQDGVRVWFDLPAAPVTWTYFNSTALNLRAPDIDPLASGNYCSVKTNNFIATGIPETSPYTVASPKRHLFCNTSLGDGPNFPPLLRLVTDRAERIWLWSAKERPVCNSSGTAGYPFTAPAATPTDYEVRVQTCTAAEAAAKTEYFKNYCKDYPTNSNAGWMPVGLLQKYSEGDGTSVCSKQFTKACNNNADCTLATEGECVAKSKMLFGLMTGSYTNNLQGGVLRKNIGSILDEVNSLTGSIQKSENARGNVAMSIDNMRTVGFSYSSYAYDTSANGGTCGWLANGPITNGQCRNWGNPIGEMMYEANRYFAGKQLVTTEFMYTTNDDAGLTLSKQGCTSSGCPKPWIQPYSLYPSCARPFILTFSDISPSFDSDTIPGTSFGAGISTDLPGLNVSTLADQIGTAEGLASTSKFIGQNGTAATDTDFLCTSKTIGNLGSVRGICPEEPNKQGTFYSAAMAYYGKDKLKYCTNSPNTTCLADTDCLLPAPAGTCTSRNINTYSIALSSPVPDITLKIGGKSVTFIPTGKSVGGCFNLDNTAAQTPKGCACTFTTDANGLHMSNCQGFCPTAQIVAFFIDKINYDSSGNLTYAKFRVNFEDVEQGADHDMDAIVTYEIAPHPLDPTNRLRVNITSDYSSTCVAMAFGFIVKGTTEDNAYLPVKLLGSTNAKVNALPLNWTKTFTVLGTSTQTLKDPLWYAAKWGGFEDSNGSHTPDLASEWDKDGDGNPDNYFLVVNPLKMEKQIEESFLSILRRASSGTAASVLASGEGSGANLVQAIFYPKRLFDREIDWTGTLKNLWYYLDPRLGNSTIREDTDLDAELELDRDYIINMFFDTDEQRTKASRWASDAAGVPGAAQPTVYLEELKYLWESGSQLHARATARDIRTNFPDNTLASFTTGLAGDATFRTLIQAADATAATNIINYVRGDSDGTGNRNRTVTDSATGTTGIWKLGDIVNSTPKIVSWIPMNKYDETYADKTYTEFLKSSTYQNRGTVFTGANDGMLHAFKLGTLGIVKDGTSKKATLTGTDLGSEQWAFIPKNALPYLKYLMDPAYCHLYYIDLTPSIFDASIEAPGVHAGDYWTQSKASSSWRTVLIGGMKLGGACKNANYTAAFAADPFVKTPITTAGYTEVGYSSYFAMDITDPASPQLMWEFANPSLGFATTGPSIMRINAREVTGSTSVPNKNLNGKWFVVLASGPTGSIGTDRMFKGYSDQPLSLFILDAKTGALLRTINTGAAAVAGDRINYAFGGSLNNANIDYDFDYQDDALYLGYTKSEHAIPDATTRWTNGGVIRLVTREDLNGTNLTTTGNTALNPDNWAWSHVIKDTGPVTASVGHLAHYRPGSTKPDIGWLYLGTGRFFYRGDDDNARNIAGVKDLCLRDASAAILPIGLTVDSASQFYAECTDGTTTPPANAQVAPGDLVDKTCSGLTGATLAACFAQPCVSGTPMVGSNLIQCLSNRTYKGWHIRLDSPPAERMITDPLATPTGAVFFTTFAPSPDACKFGGSSYLWAVNYETGGSVGDVLQGKALLQVSTGAIEEVDLKTKFVEEGGRRSEAIDGVPPTGQGLAIVVPPKPIGKIMHIRKE